MTGDDTGFVPGQRVYHRQLDQFGTYERVDFFLPETSFVEFDDGQERKVTTAQLVAADEVEENA